MRRLTINGYEPQLIALAIVTVLAFVVILVHVLAQLHYGCNPGPKPPGLSVAQWALERPHVCH
jgi:hypothetical protein